jgi:hypothetical protein
MMTQAEIDAEQALMAKQRHRPPCSSSRSDGASQAHGDMQGVSLIPLWNVLRVRVRDEVEDVARDVDVSDRQVVIGHA